MEPHSDFLVQQPFDDKFHDLMLAAGRQRTEPGTQLFHLHNTAHLFAILLHRVSDACQKARSIAGLFDKIEKRSRSDDRYVHIDIVMTHDQHPASSNFVF
jgi:hypothetical protein